MSSAEHPHTRLSESTRAFSAEIENVRRQLADLGVADQDAVEVATAAIERLQQAQEEVVA